jgi:hypothetical protein
MLPTIEDLGECLAGQLAVIVGAGPSLASALPSLARHTGAARFACIQALPTLGQAGARVNFVLNVDPANLFARCRVEQETYDVLLTESSSRPDIVAERMARACLFHVASPDVHDIAWRAAGLPVIDEPALTVSETSLLLAHSLGARRFLLTGVDLASEDGRYSERFLATGARGEPVATNSHYFHAARFLDTVASRWVKDGCELWRTGGAPALPIAACRQATDADVDALLEAAAALRVRLPQPSLHPGRLAASRRVLDEIAAGKIGSPPSEESAARSGRGRPKGMQPLASAEGVRAAKRTLPKLDELPRSLGGAADLSPLASQSQGDLQS